MISVVIDQNNLTSERLASFPAHADRLLKRVEGEGLTVGRNAMRSHAPGLRSGKLYDSIRKSPIVEIAPGHYTGVIYADPAVAPYAGMVDRGTGIDGPHHVRVVRPNGVMKFTTKRGTFYRHVVKDIPSLKIQAGMGYRAKAFRDLKSWAEIRTGVLTVQLAEHFTDEPIQL